MITTTTDLLNSGLNVSDEITDARLERVIRDTEMGIVKPRLGDPVYIEINDDPVTYEDYIKGGVVTYTTHDRCGREVEKTVLLSGLKEAVCHIAFGMLLRDNAVSTTYGSVIKEDEFSVWNAPDEIRGTAVMHYELGLHYLDEVCEALGVEKGSHHYGIQWGEFIG